MVDEVRSSHRKVSQLLALTKSGLKDWLLQRISAVVMALYVIFFMGFFLSHPDVTASDWMVLFSHPWMKIISLFVLLMLLAHAWIGIWTVLTDYIHCSAVRGVIQGIIIFGFFICLVWGVSILF
jgi:succinate dehydrogenase / fumarate reductase membrane anchor subunit